MILDVNYGSKEKIKAVEGDNLERIETIYLKANGEIVNLQGLTCDMAYMDISNIGVGNVIENLTISNPTGGEVQLPINSEITKRNGYYNCELRLKNSSGLIKHTAYFELEISKNLFNSISKAIINTDTFNSIKEILSNADTYNKDLENKLNTLSSLDSSNAAAKENIKSLTDNNAKAIESNKTLESTNTVATSKTTELNNAVEESKKYIEALSPDKNIPDLKLEIQGMQEQLKNKQSLAYKGSNITCKNSLEGRTTGLKLKGRTLQNLFKVEMKEDSVSLFSSNGIDKMIFKSGVYTFKNTSGKRIWYIIKNKNTNALIEEVSVASTVTKKLNDNEYVAAIIANFSDGWNSNAKEILKNQCIVLKGDNIEEINYFEGIKNVGNKIEYLSCNANLFRYKLTDFTGADLNNFKIENNILKFSNSKKFSSTSSLDLSYLKGKTVTISSKAKNGRIICSNVIYKGQFNGIMDTTTAGDSEGVISRTFTITEKSNLRLETPYDNKEVSFKEIMINEGEEIKPFIDHREDLKTITLPLGVEFSGLETVQDIIEETSKGIEYTQNSGKAVLDGTHDNWLLNTVRENTITFYFRGIYQSPYENDTSIICNYPVSTEGFKQDIECIFKTSIGFYLSIKKSKLETPDVDGLKKYLKANPITVDYQLATPVKTILKDVLETDVDTYQDTTHVLSLNSIPATLDFNIATNYGSVLNQHSIEINNIWDTINNLIVPALIDTKKTVAMASIKNNL